MFLHFIYFLFTSFFILSSFFFFMVGLLSVLIFSMLFLSPTLVLWGVVICTLFFFTFFNYSFLNSVVFKSSLFYLDSFSYYLIFLSLLLFLFIFVLEYSNKFYLFWLLKVFLLLILFLIFISKRVFFFFLMFEFSFFFIFLIVMLWGVNPERIDALNYFLVYSLVGSLPFIFYLTYCFKVSRFGYTTWHLKFFFLKHLCHEGCDYNCYRDFYLSFRFFTQRSLVHISGFFLFLIKFPIYGLHLWLPKVHVESPLYGSMLLAGILIKLGVFGLCRVFIFNMFFHYLSWFHLFLFFYLPLSLLLVSFVCSRQFDIKSYVAYSSVVHMSLVLMSIWIKSFSCLVGCLYLSFSHGLCSSAMFLNSNLFYSYSHSRNIFLNRGYLFIFPLVSLFWFLFCSLNCSVPPSLNFFSELLLIFSISSFNSPLILFTFFNIFFGGCYSIFLYSFFCHGKIRSGINYNTFFSSFFHFPILILFFHFFILFLFIFFSDSFLLLF